jgi:hypothetical protein
MSDIARVLAMVEGMSVAERKDLLAHLRRLVPPHPMEARLRASAETLLEAIRRASPLTIRGVEGILAEASFATEVVPELPDWSELPVEANTPYDFLLKNRPDHVPLRVQVKMQRRKNHRPWMANEAMKSSRQWPAEFYVVEVQQTRAGRSAKGVGTRPYRFGEFDVLAVSLGAATGAWRNFMYTVANWLLPDPDDLTQILKYQPVSPIDNEDWTASFEMVAERARSGRRRKIMG